MSRYFMNDFAFDLPDIGFVDKTVTALDGRSEDRPVCAVTVFRRPAPVGKTLFALVEENLRNGALHLRRHVVLSRRDIEVVGHPAIDLATQWQGQEAVIYTRQVHFIVEGTWLLLSANAPLTERPRCDGVLDRAVETFRLRA